MRWCLLIPIVVLSLFLCDAKAQELPITHFTPDSEVNALPSAMVTYVHQDRQGFIWFAVYSSGLVRYDGVRMELFDQQDGLDDLGIWQILEDHSGYLWVASHGGVAVSEKPLSDFSVGSRVRFVTDINGQEIYNQALTQNQLALDTQGRILIGTSGQGIIRYQINEYSKLLVEQISTDLNSERALAVTSLLADRDGGFYASFEDGSLYHVNGNQPRLLYSATGLDESSNINSMFLDAEDNIWGYRQNGEILFLKKDSGSLQTVAKTLPANITSITSVSDQTIWAVNSTSGITKLNKSNQSIAGSYTRVNGLLSNNAFQAMEDREGNVWIAQSGGLSKLRYNYQAYENFSASSNIGERPVLPTARVNTVMVAEDELSPCRIWVGTEGGATCIFNDGTSQYITKDDGLTGNWVNGLAKDDVGRLWVATTQGLNGIAFPGQPLVVGAVIEKRLYLRGTLVTLFSVPNTPPFIAAENLDIFNAARNSYEKSAWFPGLRSLFGVVNNRIYSFDMESGLPSTLFKSVAFDGDGYLWVGTLDQGIYRSNRPISVDALEEIEQLQSEKIIFNRFWANENEAPTNHIEKMRWYNGAMWIGTQMGLFKVDPASRAVLKHFNLETGLPANNTVSFDFSDKSENLWVGTNRGLVEINPVDGEVLQTITRQDGLIDNEVWLYGSVKTDSRGSVYYGTANGLTVFHPDLNKSNDTPPVLNLISADVSYQSEGKNEATFEYAALSFGNVSQVRYQTRLLGYDDNWSLPSADVRLRYTNLPAYFWAKKYTLEIMATNESGISSDSSLVYTFYIEPAWWLTWWAFLGYIFGFGFILFVADRFQRARLIQKERDAARLREAELIAETATARSKTAEAQAKVLEKENERKALELEKARELEIAYHELQSAQKQLIQAEKMASLGRLSTGIAHEIKNPLNFINNFAEVSGELVEELVDAIETNNKEEIIFLMETLKHNTSKIEEHGKKADSIVRSMMQHARGSKSTFELFDLNDLIDKYVNLAYQGKKNQVQNFYVEVKMFLDPDLRPVKVVGQEISQVLLNIIGNSLDAVWGLKTKKNGDYDPEITIATSQKDNYAEIRISDNGPGIPEEIREKVFEPFFTTKPTGEGTGLGLSLSYDIITQGHNGALWFENMAEGGVTFIITLQNPPIGEQGLDG